MARSNATSRAAYDLDFVRTIDNPFFPLKPGTTFFYEAADGSETIEFSVTRKTIEILGVTCTVILDTVRDENGQLVEKTLDYFAQDEFGNVWYFGELAKNYVDGKLVDTAGSWRAGVDGAKPGFIMKAHPRVGDVYNQENAPGIAEDMGKVLSRNSSANTPYAQFDHALKTLDFTPLDPAALEHKFYAKGIGTVMVVDLKSGDREHLVKIKVEGTGNRDMIAGFLGSDELFGRGNNDHLNAKAGDDFANGGSGNDSIYGGPGEDTIAGGAGSDRLYGDGGKDFLSGGLGKDLLKGGDAGDRLTGGDNGDRLHGGAGQDILRGDLSSDILKGGDGADRFVFKALADSRTGVGRDLILDFMQDADRIGVAAIDAEVGTPGNQTFSFIGGALFSGAEGELRFAFSDKAGTANDRTIVEGDVNGDGHADLEIALKGLVMLTGGDFLL